jgi:hypothetical protein
MIKLRIFWAEHEMKNMNNVFVQKPERETYAKTKLNASLKIRSLKCRLNSNASGKDPAVGYC